jgi:hypothetical protein
MVFAPFGTTDVRITLDTNALLPGAWDTSRVSFNGSPIGWSSTELRDDGAHGDQLAGDGVYTFQLSSAVGPGSPFPHRGLLSPGEYVDFRYFLGLANPVQYTVTGTAAQAGIAAFARPAGAPAFTPVTVSVFDEGRPCFTVP